MLGQGGQRCVRIWFTGGITISGRLYYTGRIFAAVVEPHSDGFVYSTEDCEPPPTPFLYVLLMYRRRHSLRSAVSASLPLFTR